VGDGVKGGLSGGHVVGGRGRGGWWCLFEDCDQRV
jgi:hypothetical protein